MSSQLSMVRDEILKLLPEDLRSLYIKARQLEEELDSDDDPSDDLSEEDDAIDLLQQFTEEGLIWTMRDGDLILTEEEECE